MKVESYILSAMLFLIFTATSCKKEEKTNLPSIIITELGYENTKTAFPGSDLHMEATIVAEGKIASIIVEIHPEGEHSLKSGSSLLAGSWGFDSTYTGKYAGVKNTEFHEHIEIPATADTGHYHFHFILTDMEGNQSAVEEELHITIPTDREAPVVTVNNAPSDGQAFVNGQTITISGVVTDDIAIAEIYIALVAQSQGLPDSLVNQVNTITLLHTHEFHDPSSVSFQAQLIVGAATDNDEPDPKPITWTPGNYYILVKSPDAFGGNVGFSAHYPIVIN
jgi:hypothetical protein